MRTRDTWVHSKAPHLIKLSITRRFTAVMSTRRQKSNSDSKGPSLARLCDDHLDRLFTDVFDTGQAETDLGAHRSEIGAALVDVGRQHHDVFVAALGDVFDDLVGIAHFQVISAAMNSTG